MDPPRKNNVNSTAVLSIPPSPASFQTRCFVRQSLSQKAVSAIPKAARTESGRQKSSEKLVRLPAWRVKRQWYQRLSRRLARAAEARWPVALMAQLLPLRVLSRPEPTGALLGGAGAEIDAQAVPRWAPGHAGPPWSACRIGGGCRRVPRAAPGRCMWGVHDVRKALRPQPSRRLKGS